MTKPHVHVYPVDASLTPEQAWQELVTHGKRVTFTGGILDDTWQERWCDGTECIRIRNQSNQNEEN